jgi:type I restriction enzyme M protein
MLPMTVLRRFDCVLESTKQDVLAKYEQYKERFKDDALDSMLNKAADQRFHNRSELTLEISKAIQITLRNI